MVYFIQAEIGGPVKIGHTSRSINQRLRDLQCGSPFKLCVVGVIPDANLWEERKLHERFADRRIHGEWFDLTGVDHIFRECCKAFRVESKSFTPPLKHISYKPRTLPGPYWPMARSVLSILDTTPSTAKQLCMSLQLENSNKLTACLRMLSMRGWIEPKYDYLKFGQAAQWYRVEET